MRSAWVVSAAVTLACAMGWAAGAAAQDAVPLTARLESAKDRGSRRRAIQDLAQLGGRDAWQAVLELGLRDEEPMVADEAQIQISEAQASEGLLKVLDSKVGLGSKDALVRQRILEALGGTCLLYTSPSPRD